MNTNDLKRERISALADGELTDAQFETALAALRDEDVHADWNLYHQIGDVLRSEDMAVQLSPAFSARLSAQLAAEPTYIAATPVAGVARRKWQLVAGAAAVATFAFVMTPPLMEMLQPVPTAPGLADVPTLSQEAVVMTASPEGVILRDPRIDDYLFAHQRFSPSLQQDGAEHARNAKFSSK